ncbi:MAG: outer membrane protein assembly factor BamA [Calditrichaeota bacterium]|nr:outer membrane protein assembly factor BamA [Calditrichota bacterium]
MLIRIKIICLLLASFAFVNNTAAQSGAEFKLLSVAVEGNSTVDAGLIIAASGLVVGDNITGDKIQNAIRSLWKLNLFSDVRIIADLATANGIYLLVKVEEYPRLEFVDVSGGKKAGKADLEKAVDLNKGQVVKPSDPLRIKQKITKLCAEKGYLLADIAVEIRAGSAPDRKNLFVKVVEGKKVRIKQIKFTGNTAVKAKILRKQMKATKQRGFFRSGEFKSDKFLEDKTKIVEYYREHGFRDAEVLSDSIWYSDDLKRMFIRIDISEGVKYYFGDVSFSGAELFNEAELLSQLMFRRGDEFNQTRFEATMHERLSALYYDRGYIFAQIAPELTPRGDTLDIHYQITPGNRFSVRRINITGNTKTRDKVIRREFSLKPGETFDVSKLRRSLRDVTILNFFGKVEPDVEDVSEDEVDLWVKVEEKPTDQANMSVGYSERDKFIGAIGFTAPNLFGRGQQLNLDWNFGQNYGSFSISFTEPWLFDTKTLVGGSFYNIRRRWVNEFNEYLLGGSLRFGRSVRWPDDYCRGDWIYRVERSRYTNLSDAYKARSDATLVEGEVRWSNSITQILTRDSRDYPEFPTTGSVASLSSELAGGPLTGDDRYHKHIASLDWYSPLFKKFILYNHLTYGYLEGLTDKSRDIPPLKYFYMGGGGLALGTPLRGYEDRTIGPPASSGGYAQGGKVQFKTTIELRIQIVENPTIYGLTFWEAGNTWLNFRQTDLFDLKRSAGLGVRFYMPLIGLIGFDYGFGFDYYNVAGVRRGRWVPHFQFGRQF